MIQKAPQKPQERRKGESPRDGTSLKQQAATRSAARQKKKPEEARTPLPPSPKGVVKTSPTGKQYRVYTIPIMDYPRFMETEGLESKLYFYYVPESDWVLGVRRKGEKEEVEV